MSLSRLIFTIAAVVVGIWIIGFIFRFAAWLINGLLYVAAIIVIAGLILAYVEKKRGH